MPEKIRFNQGAEDILEDADKEDVHLGGIDFSKIPTLDKEIYMQMADIRRKMESAGDITSLAGRIDNLSSIVKDSARGNISEDEKNFLGLISNKLQNLSLMVQREVYKRRKHEKQA